MSAPLPKGSDPYCDVLVVGMGPVGLLLALLLGRRGVRVLAVDAAPEPYLLPRAAVVDDEVLRIFQRAGVADEVLADCQVQEQVSFVTARGRKIAIMRPVDGVEGHPPLVSINQPALERTIAAAIDDVPGVEMRRGCALERFEQDADGVTATLRSVGGEPETVRARWLVGCDGSASLVRRLLGVEFGGSTYSQRWLVVDVLVDRPLASVPHPHFFGDWQRPTVSLPMSPGRHRWEWMIHPGEDPGPFLDRASIDQRIKPWLDGEEAELERAVVYTFHARMASRWRDGRVFLAGDAAHVTPPFAGQGFSSGARDAANLAWKLEDVLAGAPDALLGTYEAERRPHVRAMTKLAMRLGGFVQTANRSVAAIRDAYLTAMDVSGANEWLQSRIKPVPAYGDGAFAEKPHPFPPKRGVGSQFPQPTVHVGAERMLLDEALGAGWRGIASDAAAAEALGAEGLDVRLLGRDLDDVGGEIAAWLTRFDADWVVLRPDRFVFALGAEEADVPEALAELHRRVGRALTQRP